MLLDIFLIYCSRYINVYIHLRCMYTFECTHTRVFIFHFERIYNTRIHIYVYKTNKLLCNYGPQQQHNLQYIKTL